MLFQSVGKCLPICCCEAKFEEESRLPSTVHWVEQVIDHLGLLDHKHLRIGEYFYHQAREQEGSAFICVFAVALCLRCWIAALCSQ